jgi:deoxynucleoside triphosphate triphosphohydrolase SAMHD1
MSVDSLRRIRNGWQSDSSFQFQVNRSLDKIGFTEDYVAHATSPNYEKSLPRKSKQIKDNQWGMIEFDWRAMRLIDSPLMQRLRYIKQLGFSYLTYPSAEHSRFSHSLGTGHVVINFIKAIDKRANETEKEGAGDLKYVCIDSIPDLSSRDLVHAALLHDIGHLPYSHVTEKIVSSQSSHFTLGKKPVDQILLEVNETLRKNLPLSEILTLVYLCSERFEKFYLQHVCVGDSDSEQALLTVCSLIAGAAPKPMLTGISELISGAVDADKVDYVNRDALNCGIPVGVDVARVFLRSGVIEASKDQIRDLGLKNNPAYKEYLFVINSSGLDTIDEILQARTSLYQRVYFHAVTRTAERLLGRAFEVNSSIRQSDSDLTDVLRLWTQADGTLLERLLNSSERRVRALGSRLCNRCLPKKAYSFSPGLGDLQMPLEEILPRAMTESITAIKKQVNNTIIEAHLREEHLWRGEGATIEGAIRTEISKIRKALKKTKDRKLKEEVAHAKLDCLLMVGCAHEKQKRHNQIISQNDYLLTIRDYTNSGEQQVAYELLKEVGFVLSDDECRSIVFFASRVILASISHTLIKTDLMIAQSDDSKKAATEEIHYITRFLPDYSTAVLKSGIPRAQIDRVERALTETGYFDDRPWASAPLGSNSPDALQISSRLKAFDGYRSWRVTPKSVAAFLSQFPSGLRESMADELKSITVVDAQTTIARLGPLLDQLGGSVDVVAFSATSGAQVQNWLRKEFRSNSQHNFPADLGAALKGDRSGPIVFVDDNAASGIQARAQFLSLLNVPRDKWPLDCRDEDDLFSPLTSLEIEALKKREVYLYVCAGVSDDGKTIKDCLDRHGFNNVQGLKYAEQIDAHEWSTELKEFLTDVGQHLVAWSRFHAPYESLTKNEKAHCKKRSFGYQNVGGWITTILSVPTATVTPLWCPGLYKGQPWMPLLLRSNKLKHLVVG